MNKTYLSLGSNRGDRKGNLDNALKLLAEKAGEIVHLSSLYETPPWGMVDETDFINQALLFQTDLTANLLMDTIIQIELLMGRTRTAKGYEPRTIDIDILFFNSEIINNEKLSVPHPLLYNRRFVLEPMAEIAPGFIHPVFQKSIEALLSECGDKSLIRKSVSK